MGEAKHRFGIWNIMDVKDSPPAQFRSLTHTHTHTHTRAHARTRTRTHTHTAVRLP